MHYAQDAKAERYAQEHKRFLEENRPDVLEQLRQSGDLNSYLSSVGEQARDRYAAALAQYNNSKEAQSLPWMERVRELQNRLQEVEEFIRHDLIYQPLRGD